MTIIGVCGYSYHSDPFYMWIMAFVSLSGSDHLFILVAKGIVKKNVAEYRGRGSERVSTK